MQLSSGGDKHHLASTKHPRLLRQLPGADVACPTERPAPPCSRKEDCAGFPTAPSLTSLPQHSAAAHTGSPVSATRHVQHNIVPPATSRPQPSVSRSTVGLPSQIPSAPGPVVPPCGSSCSLAASCKPSTGAPHASASDSLPACPSQALGPDSGPRNKDHMRRLLDRAQASGLLNQEQMQRLLKGAHAVGFCNGLREPCQPGLTFSRLCTPTNPAATNGSSSTHVTLPLSQHIQLPKRHAPQSVQCCLESAAQPQATSLLALLAGRPVHPSVLASGNSAGSTQSRVTSQLMQSSSLKAGQLPQLQSTVRAFQSSPSASGSATRQHQRHDRPFQSLPVASTSSAQPQPSQRRKLLWTSEPAEPSCGVETTPASTSSAVPLAQSQHSRGRKLLWTTEAAVKPTVGPWPDEDHLGDQQGAPVSTSGVASSAPLQMPLSRKLPWSSEGPMPLHQQQPCPATSVLSNLKPGQASVPEVGCSSPGKRKRSRLVNIAEGDQAATTGSQPVPASMIKYRCNIRDILDTCFEGWDEGPPHTAPSAQANATSVRAPSVAYSVAYPPGSNPPAPAAPSGLRSSHAPPPWRPPWSTQTKQLGTHVRPAATLASIPSKPHTQGSSSVASAKSVQDEQEAKRAMPPPLSSPATAESLQAAVAAAQKEEWATAAHAAAWGKPFAEPFAQLGSAAWNTAFPRQVAELMTCMGSQRPPRPTPFVPSSQHALQYYPAMLQPPPSAIKPTPLRLQPATVPKAASEPPISAQTDAPSKTAASAVVDPSSNGLMQANAGAQQDAQALGDLHMGLRCSLPNTKSPSGSPSSIPSERRGGLPTGAPPWQWVLAEQPVMLSSLPHVMHQLLCEANTDFLQTCHPLAESAAATAAGLVSGQASFAGTHAALSVQQESDAVDQPTPLQQMKKRARQRVAKSICPSWCPSQCPDNCPAAPPASHMDQHVPNMHHPGPQR